MSLIKSFISAACSPCWLSHCLWSLIYFSRKKTILLFIFADKRWSFLYVWVFEADKHSARCGPWNMTTTWLLKPRMCSGRWKIQMYVYFITNVDSSSVIFCNVCIWRLVQSHWLLYFWVSGAPRLALLRKFPSSFSFFKLLDGCWGKKWMVAVDHTTTRVRSRPHHCRQWVPAGSTSLSLCKSSALATRC